jgi:diketogulonate reductase-like aldo/keto reductase|tara:strand:- start:16552 stop:17460 length:909 start_codon:yes stop_codon:yes gene_type:complete
LKQTKRNLFKLLSASFLLSGLKINSAFANYQMLERIIPSTKKSLPVIGLGTSRVFDIKPTTELLSIRQNILDILLDNGGTLIDTSPMYGKSEEIIGRLIETNDRKKELFLATKVWTKGKSEGENQIKESFRKMHTSKIQLIQIHNLLDWKTQITTLRKMKESGEIEYIGITHSKADAFPAMEKIIVNEPIDFAQFNYSLGEREAENRLLPLCADQGVATIINRPFMRAKLFRSVKGKVLPSWCNDYGIGSWGQFFLKYILSNPAVTNIIPATSKPKNMLDNSLAGIGRIPDSKMKRKMLEVL